MASRLTDWFKDDDRITEATRIHSQLKFLETHLFSEFEGLDRGSKNFMKRLSEWVIQAPDEEDRLEMLRLAEDLYFVGRAELQQLHEDVFQTIIAWWIIDKFGLDCVPRVPANLLGEALDATWFTAITDSLELAKFHHINGIHGKNLRPEWAVLHRLGDPAKITAYMMEESLQAVVVMEDFVGSGTQADGPLRFLLSNIPETPVLFAPLVVCSAGDLLFQELEEEFANLTYEPLVRLGETATISKTPLRAEPARHAGYRALFKHVRPLVGYQSRAGFPQESDFGFAETGSLAVLYTNCPNNVPPLIHHDNEPQWTPLFPRTVRK